MMSEISDLDLFISLTVNNKSDSRWSTHTVITWVCTKKYTRLYIHNSHVFESHTTKIDDKYLFMLRKLKFHRNKMLPQLYLLKFMKTSSFPITENVESLRIQCHSILIYNYKMIRIWSQNSVLTTKSSTVQNMFIVYLFWSYFLMKNVASTSHEEI